MIDLTIKGLPSHIEWDGGRVEVLTDFRIWLRFKSELVNNSRLWLGIFPGKKAPDGTEWMRAAIDFLESRNSTPRPLGMDGPRLLDEAEDGEYIVAAFQQAYGIDLTVCDMHWHRFKALLSGLPDSVKLSSIMGYRGWNSQSAKRKHEDIMAEQRAIWALEEASKDDGYGGFGAILASIN